MLHENIQSDLFVQLSNEQQQVVGGGGPTLGIVADVARHTLNTAPVISSGAANTNGATSTGAAAPLEIDSLAAQTALGATGGGNNLEIPEGLTFPSMVN